MTLLDDPTLGAGYAFGAILPSTHMTTIATQQPRAVDGGTPSGSIYPGDIEFSGTHTHDGTIVADTGAAIELNGGSNLLINGTLNGTPTGGSIDLVNVTLGLNGIEVTDLTFKVDESTPTISQPKPAGVGNPGANGYPATWLGQPGQDGNGNPAGDGGDLVLGPGLPGSGTPNGELGRLVTQWGDSASYKWPVYQWCSGEMAWITGTTVALTVDIPSGEHHIAEVYLIGRDTSNRVKTQKRAAGIYNDAGTVTFTSSGNVFTFGNSPVQAQYEALNPSNQWRVNLSATSDTGDAVIFLQWRVATLDGA
jgi:hypothetical protein